MISIYKSPYDWSWTGNPIYFQLYSSDAYTDPTVTIEVKLFFKRVADSVYSELPVITYSPVNGLADINLDALLDSILEYKLPGFNIADEKKSWPITLQSCLYYISYREITTGDPDPDWIDGVPKYGVKGGIDFFKWRGNNYFANYYVSQKPFLTWQRNGRLAAYSERMYLLWLQANDIDTRSIKAKAKAFYVDGTDATAEKVLDTVTRPQGTLYFVPAGAAQWDLAGLNGAVSPVLYWEIGLYDCTDNDNPVLISELFRYNQDNRTDYNATTLHYRNSLGGLDSARVRGTIEINLSYDYGEKEKIVPADYFNSDALIAGRLANPGTEDVVWKGDIGFVSKIDQERFRDLHIQRECYWAIDSKWWPLINVTENLKLRNSQDKLFAMPFAWKLGISGNRFFTPREVDLDTAVPAGPVCYSGVILLSIAVDTSGPDAQVTVNVGVSDPQAVGVTQFQYRIPGFINAWTTFNLSALPLIIGSIPKNQTYQFLVRALCPNGVTGPIRVGGFNTIDSGGGSGGDSFFYNNSAIEVHLTVKVNGVIVVNNQPIPAGFSLNEAIPDSMDSDVEITVPELAFFTTLTCQSNGISYSPSVVNTNQAIWNHVDIIGGINIAFS